MWKIDTTQTGIPSIFREYEWIALGHIYKERTGITSKSTFDYVNRFTKISRASIIIFLKKLIAKGVIDNGEESGKGGFHGVHKILVEREDLPRLITLDTIKTLRSVFPEDPFLKDAKTLIDRILPVSDRPR